jgi:hypothetical protein
MDNSLLKMWQSSLEVIRVTSQEDLAVVKEATLSSNFKAFNPDELFLYKKTINLEIAVGFSTVIDTDASINSLHDPFAVIHFMPNLEKIVLDLSDSVNRIDHFNPSLPKLQTLSIIFDSENQLLMSKDFKRELKIFETNLAPPYLQCYGVNLLKLNSVDVANIKAMYAMNSIIIESILPLSGLETLHCTPGDTVDFSIYFSTFTNISKLQLGLKDLSQIERGQLSCLSKVNNLRIYNTKFGSEGIFIHSAAEFTICHENSREFTNFHTFYRYGWITGVHGLF